ncbi:MAG: N-acetyl-gamma-glutamyl-phosphate reductase [Thermodesulfobacteriota bacterium]|nr:N-acetyl-gamma-glutamyl-phosphate reductase [Thermodesulfobacteriota bacterium]
MSKSGNVRAAVVGATGYAGAELVRLLAGHPDVTLTAVTSRQYAGVPFNQVYPAMGAAVSLVCEAFAPEPICERADIVFTALPHKLPMSIVPELLDRGVRVVDLSADFRFSDVAAYERHYQAHTAKELCEKSVYGLCEVYGEKIKKADLVGNPGCYPTSVLLPLIPLARAGLIDTKTIIVDAKSGVSGAGRSPSLGVHICEVNESFKAYKVATHRHAPEMEEILGDVAGTPVALTFVPHLVPMTRGMLSTIYANPEQAVSEQDIRQCLADYYRGRPFVRLCGEGAFPETRFVRGTNFCDIGVRVDTHANRLILVSAIDNLVKGAAGQAVQNMNLMFGVDEGRGLDMIPFPV